MDSEFEKLSEVQTFFEKPEKHEPDHFTGLYNYHTIIDICKISADYFEGNTKMNLGILNLLEEKCNNFKEKLAKILMEYSDIMQIDPSLFVKLIHNQLETFSIVIEKLLVVIPQTRQKLRDLMPKSLKNIEVVIKTISKSFDNIRSEILEFSPDYKRSMRKYIGLKSDLSDLLKNWREHIESKDIYNLSLTTKLKLEVGEQEIEFKKSKDEFSLNNQKMNELFAKLEMTFKSNKEQLIALIYDCISGCHEEDTVMIKELENYFKTIKHDTFIKLLDFDPDQDEYLEDEKQYLNDLTRQANTTGKLRVVENVNIKRQEILDYYHNLISTILPEFESFFEDIDSLHKDKEIKAKTYEKISSLILSSRKPELFHRIKALFDDKYIKSFQGLTVEMQNISKSREKSLKEHLSKLEKIASGGSIFSCMQVVTIDSFSNDNPVSLACERFIKDDLNFAKSCQQAYRWLKVVMVDKMISPAMKVIQDILNMNAKKVPLKSEIEEFCERISILSAKTSEIKPKALLHIDNPEGLDNFNQTIPLKDKGKLELDSEREDKINDLIKEKPKLNKSLSFKINSDSNIVEIDSFTCAYVGKIDVLGKMYITQSQLCFYSVFNSRTLLGETVVSIPYSEINQIEKWDNFFKNGLIIQTKKGIVEFTSVMSRDEAYNCLEKILTLANPDFKPFGHLDVEKEEPEIDIIPEVILQRQNSSCKKERKKAMLESQYIKRCRAIKRSLPPKVPFPNLAFRYTYDVPYKNLIDVIIGQKNIQYNGQSYPNFWALYQVKLKCSDTFIGEWEPEYPKNVTKKKDLLSFDKPMKRFHKSSKPLGHSIPFLPKSVAFEETQVLYLMNETETILNLEVELKTSVPMSDCFKFSSCFIFKSEGENKSSIEEKYDIEWIKHTFFKSQITSASVEEVVEAGKILHSLIQELISQGVFKSEDNSNEESDVENPLDNLEEEEEKNDLLQTEDNRNIDLIEGREEVIEEISKNVNSSQNSIRNSVGYPSKFKVGLFVAGYGIAVISYLLHSYTY